MSPNWRIRPPAPSEMPENRLHDTQLRPPRPSSSAARSQLSLVRDSGDGGWWHHTLFGADTAAVAPARSPRGNPRRHRPRRLSPSGARVRWRATAPRAIFATTPKSSQPCSAGPPHAPMRLGLRLRPHTTSHDSVGRAPRARALTPGGPRGRSPLASSPHQRVAERLVDIRGACWLGPCTRIMLVRR